MVSMKIAISPDGTDNTIKIEHLKGALMTIGTQLEAGATAGQARIDTHKVKWLLDGDVEVA